MMDKKLPSASGSDGVRRNHRLDLIEQDFTQTTCGDLRFMRLLILLTTEPWSNQVDHCQSGYDRQETGHHIVEQRPGEHAAESFGVS